MRIGELLENDPFKGIKDFAANFKKGGYYEKTIWMGRR